MIHYKLKPQVVQHTKFQLHSNLVEHLFSASEDDKPKEINWFCFQQGHSHISQFTYSFFKKNAQIILLIEKWLLISNSLRKRFRLELQNYHELK